MTNRSDQPLGSAADLSSALGRLAAVIDARAAEGGGAKTSYTAKLLQVGPALCAKKLGEEAVEAALALAAGSDEAVASESADVLFHLLVALRSRGLPLDEVAAVLTAREGVSGLDEKASRNR
ncbi:phosphoribosyl-ATP diphosphatase [bacterium]|nr:phosphoribosyl-ATP diphosphatase [bacterium]